MFDLKKTDQTKIENVSVVHFKDDQVAKKYIETKSNYNFITYTPSRYAEDKFATFKENENWEGNAHKVIGQEFDNVIVIMDEYFHYDANKKLICKIAKEHYYDQERMLFQAVTRTKQKLEIVVINNTELFKELLNIINKNQA